LLLLWIYSSTLIVDKENKQTLIITAALGAVDQRTNLWQPAIAPLISSSIILIAAFMLA